MYGKEKNLQQFQRYSTKEMFERVFMDSKEIMNVNKLLSLIDSKENAVPFESKLNNTIKEIENDDEQQLNDNTIETHNDEEVNDIFSTKEKINDTNDVISFSSMHYRKNVKDYIPIRFKNFITSSIFHEDNVKKDTLLRDKIYGGTFLRLTNINRLKGPICLDDEVMNCYLLLLSLKHKEYYYFITHFFTNLVDERFDFDYNFKKVVRWFYKDNGIIQNIFERPKLFMTMNYPYQEHWEFIYADMKELTLYFHDSCSIALNKQIQLMRLFLRFLKELYSLFYPNQLSENDEIYTRWKNFEVNDKGWKILSPSDPQQSGGVDCGVFTLMKIEVLSEGLSAKEILQADMENYRLLIAFNLLLGKLIY